MRWHRVIFLIGALAVLVLASYIGQVILRGGAFGFGSSMKAIDYIWMSLATILGVLASVLVTGLRSLPQDERVHLRQLADIMLRPGCLIALCVSPIVFYGVLIAANATASGLFALLASFQNGFFWEQILRNQGRTVAST